MNQRILLVEPNYANKYPPIGLMKIAFFHKEMLHDYVRFTKGRLPEAYSETKWDRVYVTSLFTFEWAVTIEAIKYALSLVETSEQVYVGGIAATLMPDQIFEETGVHPVCGLLNEPGRLDLPGDELIDQLITDYSILDDISDQYIYPYHDAYFLSATKGCGMRCGFCAVQTLEPHYIPYMDIREKIRLIDDRYGAKRDLLLMDNNVLRSREFNRIIDDIIEAGFGKGATFISPITGKTVKRYVDFNQGLDGNLLTDEKARRLGEIALRPARIAFDHIEDKDKYIGAIRLCAKHGITELSNYVLYNSEDFGGKGQSYQADSPSDLYARMRISLDLKEAINAGLSEEAKVSIFSFPMRYIPLSAHERGYVGTKWNAKFLRAFQCMLIPTQGKGVGSVSFFEADFGRNAAEFLEYLCMPDKLIAARGKFSVGGRGRTKETEAEIVSRKEEWNLNQERILEWKRLFALLGDEQDEFIDYIGDNEYLPEKALGLRTEVQTKLYLHYLTVPRILQLLGKTTDGSPTRKVILEYITKEYPAMFERLANAIANAPIQQKFMFRNFLQSFGSAGIERLLGILAESDFDADKQLSVWAGAVQERQNIDVDFDLIRLYRRYVIAHLLPENAHVEAHESILEQNMSKLGSILMRFFDDYAATLESCIEQDVGKEYLSVWKDRVLRSCQEKLFRYTEVQQ